MSIAFQQRAGLGAHRILLGLFAFLLGLPLSGLTGASLSEARNALIEGNYELCIKQCRESIRGQNRPNENWFLLLIQAQLTVGKYDDAYKTLEAGLDATRERSIRLYYDGRKVAYFQNRPAEAQKYVEKINELAGSRGWAYQDPENLIALGKTALVLGAEPRWVLEFFFDPGRKADPPLRNSILAAGQLALDKEDFAVAATTFREGLTKFEEDPDLLFGLASALKSSDQEGMSELLERALDVNPRHIPSLLMLADHYINAEEYRLAEDSIAKVIQVNADHPEAWAYRAVIAHLASDPVGEKKAHEQSLKHWKTNPAVDHLIGKKLSQKYRFQEGAAYQRAALKSDPDYSRSQIHLAQDLLRLGQEEEGWRWAARAHEKDGYNVTAYNLVTLKTTLDKYVTLESDSFIVRMPADEAPIFGDQVLELLEEAKTTLCEKYGVTLKRRIILELFGHQKDFGVRTFGMPHNPGFLGVCFGNVITANSPSTQGGNPSNWRAVLWHEFCHVVTLTMTENKMPRWLSEGISVYEELQKDPSWGQSMTPEYRDRILGGGLTPVSELSAAFMRANSNEAMQFAYYESALVVQYLVETYGMGVLVNILNALGEGVLTNEALAQNTVSIQQLDEQFESYAQALAKEMGSGLNWDMPEDSLNMVSTEMALATNPDNYYLLLRRAEELVKAEQWQEAMVPLKKILAHYPLQPGNDAAPRYLAQCYRGLEDYENERQTLQGIAAADNEAPDVYLRLIKLDLDEERWDEIYVNVIRLLAVNPLIPQPYRYLARSSEALGDVAQAIGAYRNLLQLDPHDPAGVHFQLARLLHQSGESEAHYHVIRALEEAPRFRDAYRLLRSIKGLDAPSPESPDPTMESVEE
ncbi:MAG: Lipopolysaccharide assembly protein B [Verrucomicrobia subdivision 3 bacterium]|nr:Lipopolysaccharide assembly protein B [Limisphaerales bacterium]MCS1413022.1 Lipopolysaccharide assembly protein B [Limisphaerales bacterium]